MSRKDNAPSVRIIGHTKYILEKRNLLCETNISNPKLWIDMHSKTKRLYFPQGKVFIMETVSDMTSKIISTEIISEKNAKAFMNKHSDGIIEKVYVKYFGEPEDL